MSIFTFRISVHLRIYTQGKGRRRTSLEAFFDEIGDEASKGLETIAIPAKALAPGVDKWDAYIAAIKARVPQAAIVFYKVHVIRNYSKVIDRVRLDEFRRSEKEDMPILKGNKYLLLKNRENLTEEQEPRLERVLDLNKNLNVAYSYSRMI